jgi:hypothetical protein
MRAFAILLLFALCSCAQNPSETQGKETLKEYLAKEVDETPFEIVRFSKSDGQSLELMGAPAYKLIFVAEVQFPKGYHPDCLNLEQFDGMERFRMGLACSTKFSPFSNDPLKPVPVGEKTTLSGDMVFQKSENGWLSSGVTLTPSQPNGDP